MGRSWVKVWRGLPYDRTLRRAPCATRWLWVVLLTLPLGLDGRLIADDGSPLLVDDLVDAAALPEVEVRQGLERLLAAKMLALDARSVLMIVNYRKFQESRSAASMRRSRTGATGPRSVTATDIHLVDASGVHTAVHNAVHCEHHGRPDRPRM